MFLSVFPSMGTAESSGGIVFILGFIPIAIGYGPQGQWIASLATIAAVVLLIGLILFVKKRIVYR